MNAVFHLGLVAIGSALGGVLRYGVAIIATRSAGVLPHWATMFINVAGSLFLGWFLTMLYEVWTTDHHAWIHARQEEWRLLVAVGFTGGFTTFSAFEAETYGLFRDDMAWTAIVYVSGSVFLGLVAFRVGMVLAGAK